MMTTTVYSANKISPVDALWALIQDQTAAVRAALTKRLLEQQRMADTEINANEEAFSKRIKALEGDPEGFFKLSGILGKPQQGFSWDSLREDAYTEKYAI